MLIVTILAIIAAPYLDLSKNPLVLKLLELQFYALLFYFLYSIFASVIVPIPTFPLDILMAGLYGIKFALPIRLAGALIGATAAYFIGFYFGHGFLKKILPKKIFKNFEKYSLKHGMKTYILLSLIPIFQQEWMAYHGGVSKLKFLPFIAIVFLANIYRIAFIMLYGSYLFGFLGI